MTKLFLFNIPATGHVNPTLPVAAELVRRGADLTYFLTEAYRDRVAATGAGFRPYPEVVERCFAGLDGVNPLLSVRRIIETTRTLLPETLDILQTEKPDLIIHDSMCGWAWIAADVCGIPTVSSTSTLVTTGSFALRAGLLPKLVTTILTSIPHLRAYRAAGREIERRYGVTLPAEPPGFLMRPGAITLSYTTADIQPDAEALGSTFKFVGPIIEPRGEVSFPFEQLDGRPLVYISLGTVDNDRPDFYRACLRAFAGGDRQIVMVVPEKIAATLGDIPPNFIIRPYVPQLDLLARAALCVCHGGANTVHEALARGVPLVLVPQQMEQRMTAFRVAELGAGILVPRSLPDARALASAAQRVLADPSFKVRAAQLGEGLCAAGGARRAADEILALAANSRRVDQVSSSGTGEKSAGAIPSARSSASRP